MTQKIRGKFYPLTSEVTSTLRQAKLTAAEWRIWSYLVEIDPWGDRYQDIDSLDVMSKCDCSRATFYRAIAKFQNLKIFDIQDKGFSVRNLTGAANLTSSQAEEQSAVTSPLSSEANSTAGRESDPPPDQYSVSENSKPSALKTAKPVSKMRLDSQNCESALKTAKPVSKMRPDSQNCENQPLESPPNKASRTPQTLQTYQDFKDSLSEDGREKFLNFVREKIKDFAKPINDVEGWLASKNQAGRYRWQVYYEMFQAEVKEYSTPARDWDSHPRCQEWLNLLRTKGMAFYRTDDLDFGNGEIVHFGTPEDRPEREAFAAWAEANNRIWGEES